MRILSIGEQLDISRRTPIQYEYFFIISHATSPHLALIVRNDDQWTLPHLTLSGPHFWQDVSPINEAISKYLGIPVRTVRCLYTNYDPDANRVTGLYVMESLSVECPPPVAAESAEIDSLSRMGGLLPEVRAALDCWLSEETTALALESAVPWYQVGWHQFAEQWMREKLYELGATSFEAVCQLRSWQLSSVFKIDTNLGSFYFKAVPPPISHEIELTQTLAALFPSSLPKIVSFDKDKSWFLMKDAGNLTLDRTNDLLAWERAIAKFAEIQIESTEYIGKFLGLGCPNRGLSQMDHDLVPLLSFFTAPSTSFPQFSVGEISRLSSCLAQLERLRCMLAEYSIPETLEHGDFWSPQVVCTSNGAVFLDWSHACISHPFFSFVNFAMEIEKELSGVPNARERIRNAYLEPWTQYETITHLVKASELSEPLGILHYALTQRHLLLRFSVKWEFQNTLLWYVKQLLDWGSCHSEVAI
jgi:hypothetical protein